MTLNDLDLGLHGQRVVNETAKVAATCFYHIRRLRQIRRRIGTEVTIRLVLVLSCHALTIATQY